MHFARVPQRCMINALQLVNPLRQMQSPGKLWVNGSAFSPVVGVLPVQSAPGSGCPVWNQRLDPHPYEKPAAGGLVSGPQCVYLCEQRAPSPGTNKVG